jgi:hypothetical protein
MRASDDDVRAAQELPPTPSPGRGGRLFVLIVFAAVVAAAVAIQSVGDGSGRRSGPGGKPLNPSRTGEFRGISLELDNGDPRHPYEQYVTEIADAGADTISLVTVGYQENASSASIFIDQRRTPGPARLKEIIAHARKRGLRVVLMPIVLLENPDKSEWRGVIDPGAKWNDWWEDYGNFVLHYAAIAEQTDVDVFMIGSELVSTEDKKHLPKWRDLIGQVRKAYRGRLSYSANWDHYREVRFWSDIDVIGMTTYYDLTGGKEATLERLTESWEAIKKDILGWHAKEYPKHPILFTEVGWPSQATGAQYPWDYYRATDRPDAALQARCFEAFFRTWFREKDVAGFLIWKWRNYPKQPVGPQDTGFVPCGKKQTLAVIRKYYRLPKSRQVQQAAKRSEAPQPDRTGGDGG